MPFVQNVKKSQKSTHPIVEPNNFNAAPSPGQQNNFSG
jgi:hypothetical protein